MKRTTTVIVGLAAMAGLVACGDDDKGSTAASTTVAGESPAGTDAAGDNGSADGYCEQVITFKADSDAIDVIFDADTPDPAALEAAMSTLRPQIEGLVANAPAEIQADISLVSGMQGQLIDLFEQYDYDLVALAGSPEFAEMQTMDTTELDAAADRLDAWALDTCGVSFES